MRSQRRLRELLNKGEDVTLDSVLADMKTRDARDAGRPDAPMKAAEDAILLDTTKLNANQVLQQALEYIPG